MTSSGSAQHTNQGNQTLGQFWNNTEIKPALNVVTSLKGALINLSIDLKIATKKKVLRDKM